MMTSGGKTYDDVIRALQAEFDADFSAEVSLRPGESQKEFAARVRGEAAARKKALG